ncbi:hypothetical protein KY290_022293 [Solanum tuberosum]|uniref:Uncharacterized protein n=1 Tax=Solanum tuberosum TaxID=4113 RepID=A0ABQ7V5J3_SOLTU|nr:hypothetical protein KY289_021421 [Solanum tuberosum]KAH0683670.1 hypothetical protein KY289_021422 [Solanum tuberosum]KAH0758799.1 hypothetical protein KY290_022292 [Solanum tuberosum]KAH0758800.1 hypothetical protein KY290_022293 [Solanum tuberosum]
MHTKSTRELGIKQKAKRSLPFEMQQTGQQRAEKHETSPPNDDYSSGKLSVSFKEGQTNASDRSPCPYTRRGAISRCKDDSTCLVAGNALLEQYWAAARSGFGSVRKKQMQGSVLRLVHALLL